MEDPSQETDTYPDESASVIIQDNIETPPDVPETDPGSDQPVDPVFFPTPVPGAADPIAPDGLLSLLNEETNQPGQDTNTGTDPVPSEAEALAGSPYVWGGDDPHTGADCSGFARYVYSQFGIELPRVAEDQAMVGQRINVSDALPGDLAFMMDSSGYIYHVVIYAGNGMTIEAKGRNNGIGSWPLDYSHACWAVRLIEDQNTDCRTPVIPEGAAIVTHDNLDIVLLDMK